MVCKKVNHGVPGYYPEFGAIFISNIATKRECFERKLLGLPFFMANFVNQVKAGMVLFLFEFERRELHGVFRACLDGGMNIVPEAFCFSGKQRFPAQVSFTPIWCCSPLSEKEFGSAIRENYFSSKKFHFGLSVDQVHRLLLLFSKKRLKMDIPQSLFPQQYFRSIGVDTSVIENGRSVPIDSIDIASSDSVPGVVKGVDSAMAREHFENSWHKVDSVNDRFIMDEIRETDPRMQNNTERNWPHNASEVSKKRRIDYGESFWTDISNNKHYNENGPGIATQGEYLDNSNTRRVIGVDPFLMNNGVESDPTTMHIGLVRRMYSGYNGNEIDKVRGKTEAVWPLVRSPMPLNSKKHVENPLCKLELRNEDDEFLMNDSLGSKIYKRNDYGSVLSFNNARKHSREVTCVDHKNDSSQSDCYTGYVDRHVNSRDLLGKPVGWVRTINDRGVLMHEEVDTQHNFRIGLESVLSSEHLENPCGNGSSATDEARVLCKDGIVNTDDADIHLYPFILNQYSGHALGDGRNMSGDCRYLGSDGTESECSRKKFKYSNSSDSTTSMVSKQEPSIHSCRDSLERDFSFFQVKPQHIDYNQVNSGDPISKSVPFYDCGIPHSACIRLPFRDEDFNSLNEHLPFYEEFSCSRPSTYHLEQKSHASDSYRSSLFLEPSLPSKPSPKDEVFARENKGPLSYAVGYSLSPSRTLNNQHCVGTHGKYGQEMLIPENNRESTVEDFSLYHMCSSEKDSVNCESVQNPSSKGKQSGSGGHRISVFNRLTSGSKDSIQGKQQDDVYLVHDKYMDASVDELMDMLHQCQKHRLKKLKPLISQHEDDENAKLKMLCFKGNLKNDYLERAEEVKTDVDLAVMESGGEVPKETRNMNFKRRREIRKNSGQNGLKGPTMVGNSLTDKQGKRRKLVRPVFDSIESVISDTSGPQLPLQLHCLNQDEVSSENIGKGCENISSQNVGPQSSLCVVSSNINTADAEKSSSS